MYKDTIYLFFNRKSFNYGTTYVKVGDLTPSGIFTAIREGDFIIYQPYRRDKVKEEI